MFSTGKASVLSILYSDLGVTFKEKIVLGVNQQECKKMSRELQYSTYEDIMEAFLMCSLCKLWRLYNWWCFKQFHDQAFVNKEAFVLSSKNNIIEIFLRDTRDSLEMLFNKIFCVNFPLSS